MPLSYVIRKDKPCNDRGEKRDAHIIQQEIPVGNMLIRDSREFLGILMEPTLGIDAKTFFKGLGCDIRVMKELQAHYDGTSEGPQRKQVDRDHIW